VAIAGVAVNPFPKIGRMPFAHDPPPKKIIFRGKEIPPDDSDFKLDAPKANGT
jgi:hypothetical protein